MHAQPLTHVKRTAAVALAVAGFAGLAAPAAPARVADHESQVAAAVGAGRQAEVRQDLRMPDRRDYAGRSSYEPTPVKQDLRMPDTRDAAAGRGTSTAPNVLIVKVPDPVPATGIDWTDVGIGAGGLLGLTLVSFGGTLLVAQRRRRVSPAH